MEETQLEEFEEPKQQKVNLRLKRTLFLIKNAFVKLLSQKNFNDIRINDICDEAMVHRTTFYSHFQDKYELVSSILKDLEDNFVKNVELEKTFNCDKELYLYIFEKVLDYVADNKTLFKNVLINSADSPISYMILQAVERNAQQLLEKSRTNILPELPLAVTSRFMASGFTSVGIWWLINETPYTKKDLLRFFDYIITQTASAQVPTK